MRHATRRCASMQRVCRPKSLSPPTCRCRSMNSRFCKGARAASVTANWTCAPANCVYCRTASGPPPAPLPQTAAAVMRTRARPRVPGGRGLPPASPYPASPKPVSCARGPRTVSTHAGAHACGAGRGATFHMSRSASAMVSQEPCPASRQMGSPAPCASPSAAQRGAQSRAHAWPGPQRRRARGRPDASAAAAGRGGDARTHPQTRARSPCAAGVDILAGARALECGFRKGAT